MSNVNANDWIVTRDKYCNKKRISQLPQQTQSTSETFTNTSVSVESSNSYEDVIPDTNKNKNSKSEIIDEIPDYLEAVFFNKNNMPTKLQPQKPTLKQKETDENENEYDDVNFVKTSNYQNTEFLNEEAKDVNDEVRNVSNDNNSISMVANVASSRKLPPKPAIFKDNLLQKTLSTLKHNDKNENDYNDVDFYQVPKEKEILNFNHDIATNFIFNSNRHALLQSKFSHTFWLCIYDTININNDDVLKLRRGDIIEIIQKTSNNLLIGKFGERIGLVPIKHVVAVYQPIASNS